MQSPSRPSLRISGCFARLLAISVSTVSAFATTYPITEIPTPAGLNLEYIGRVNSSGQVALGLKDYSLNPPDGQWKIALWSESQGFTLLPDFGTSFPYTEKLTDNGNLVGRITPADGSASTPFVWSASRGLQLVQAAGYSYVGTIDINDSGVLVGSALSSADIYVGFVWDPAGGLRWLDAGGGNFSSASSVTSSGTVAGVLGRADGSSGIFIWDAISGLRDITGNSQALRGPIANDRGSVVWFGVDLGTGASTLFTWDAIRGTRTMAPPTDFSWFIPSLSAPRPGGSLIGGWDMFSGAFVFDPETGLVTAFRTGAAPANALDQVATTDSSGALAIWDRTNGAVPVALPDGWVRVSPNFMNNAGVVLGTYWTGSGNNFPFAWSQTDGFQVLHTPDSIGGYPLHTAEGAAVILNTTSDGANHYTLVTLPMAAGKPDLQITGLTITPDPKKTPASSKGKGKGSDKDRDDDDSRKAKTATIKVFVANKGTGAAAASSTTLADGKKVFTTLSTPAIPAGQSVTLTYSWDLKKVEEGRHNVTAAADSAGTIAESNETNNTLKVTFTIKED